MRRSYLPGAPKEGAHLGYRTDASVRFRPTGQRTEVVCEISRRDEGETALFITRLAAAFVPYYPLRIAPELGAAVDEHDSKRTALLARLSAELPLGPRWTSALSADLARTPIALLEVRSLLRVSYLLDGGSH
jgi:hypothetical protein